MKQNKTNNRLSKHTKQNWGGEKKEKHTIIWAIKKTSQKFKIADRIQNIFHDHKIETTNNYVWKTWKLLNIKHHIFQ